MLEASRRNPMACRQTVVLYLSELPELYSEWLKQYYVLTCVGSTPTDSPTKLLTKTN